MAMPQDVSALHLVLTGDPALFAIVRLSLIVSLSAVMFAALIGVPFGALIALTRFRGREIVIVVLNALMGLPPVVVGLAVFLSLSRSGPLGSWGLLFTPQAMVIAQTIRSRRSSPRSPGRRSKICGLNIATNLRR
jgi:tungstate transport system permease protein